MNEQILINYTKKENGLYMLTINSNDKKAVYMEETEETRHFVEELSNLINSL